MNCMFLFRLDFSLARPYCHRLYNKTWSIILLHYLPDHVGVLILMLLLYLPYNKVNQFRLN